ncbi:phosphoinositide 3-kinase [Penicillium malachiteum]|uniref:phosphoinositide 3-kinase n=1 Tax=Penicillium malachiteum TaxID=1324776 RepID=UPI00254813E8|nr:phosphoinositide 3-kinase [Penicillium malachiteum]KAJ5721404.1 phosphoinositide 3-kinase [Penicillium malachiteum]
MTSFLTTYCHTVAHLPSSSFFTLADILSDEPTQSLTADGKHFVWIFSYYLIQEKRALTKSANWRDYGEPQLLSHCLSGWRLMSMMHWNSWVPVSTTQQCARMLWRGCAWQMIGASSLYPLQLIQALKYEEISFDQADGAARDLSLASFLIARAANNFKLGHKRVLRLRVNLQYQPYTSLAIFQG